MADKKSMSKHVLQMQQRLPNTRSNSVRSLVSDQDKKKYGIDRACVEPFLKSDLKTKKGKQTTHFQSTTPRQKKSSFVLSWHAIGCALTHAECDWCDRYSRNQAAHRRGSPELSTEDLANLTHRKKSNIVGKLSAPQR